jgi:zinc/manganese transport system permease protein
VSPTSHDWSILWPALIAGLLVTATHVPLGIQVLRRGIVFIDLAIAQIAGLGVVFADWIWLEPEGWAVQACALVAAVAGALFLTWTDKRWPEVQEATIGVVFVLAATGALLLLASHPHGGEHLRDLLIGQILWVTPQKLGIVAIVYAALLAAIFAGPLEQRRTLFYLVFACAATVSVQLVGLYLVFTTLIVPALATRRFGKYRLGAAYALAAGGYFLGLITSALTDLPTGPAIVWVMALLATGVFFAGARAPSPDSRPT